MGTYTDTANTAGGVNWNLAGATHVDDGTCSATTCHGTPATLPQWGVPSSVSCGSCHGGMNNGTVRNSYWPDGQSGGTLHNADRESAALRHEKHMAKLASAVYGQTIAAVAGRHPITDEKQKKLCAFCHTDPFTPAYDPGGVTFSFGDCTIPAR